MSKVQSIETVMCDSRGNAIVAEKITVSYTVSGEESRKCVVLFLRFTVYRLVAIR